MQRLLGTPPDPQTRLSWRQEARCHSWPWARVFSPQRGGSSCGVPAGSPMRLCCSGGLGARPLFPLEAEACPTSMRAPGPPSWGVLELRFPRGALLVSAVHSPAGPAVEWSSGRDGLSSQGTSVWRGDKLQPEAACAVDAQANEAGPGKGGRGARRVTQTEKGRGSSRRTREEA